MTVPIAIRQAEAADVPRIAPLFEAYRAFYGRAPEPDLTAAFLEERFARGDSAILVAILGGVDDLAGFAQLYPVPTSLSLGRAWILNDLFVSPACRGQGVARALLARAAAFGRETGAVYLELATQVTNRSAQALYEDTGWVRETEFYHYEFDLREPPSS